MRKRCFILAVFVLFSIPLLAQKHKGMSQPGRIVRPGNSSLNTLKYSDIVCDLSFQEPSGDNALSDGENGTISVLVKNKNKTVSIEPKLEISVRSSWQPNARSSVKWMDPIGPGEVGTYTAQIKWDERLPSGTVTYSAKAIDTKTGKESEPVEVSFEILGSGTGEKEVEFVDVDKTIPRLSITNRNGVAVVIGNSQYTNKDVPNVEYAKNDANTVKQYLINMLGYLNENIIYIENANKADFERIFGTERVPKGKLYNYVKPQQSDVFIYYSGHGAPDTKNKKAYFMPSNSDPNYVQIDGYPLDIFYQNLNKIPARSITVVLDACFSGASQEGMLLKNASPMYIDVDLPFYGDKINLFTSASGSQIASWYPEGKHTLFTYYFLRALRGEADTNKDRNITINEIQSFLNENVPYMARRLYGREQTPLVKGNASRVICKY